MSRKKCIVRLPDGNSRRLLRVPEAMRIVLALAPIALAAAQGPDARDIVRRSLDANQQNWTIARNYTFLQRTEERRMDASGQVKSKEVKTYDITLLQGSPYVRLVARDDHPLPPAEEKKEQDKLQKSIAERMKETPAQRERRIAEYEKRRQREQETMREVEEAFDFKIAGEDRIEGHEAWIVEASPRRDYHARSRDAKILPHVRGRLWIDKQTYHWVKLDAEVIDPISRGLFLLRLDKGAHIAVDETRVNGEVWLPRWISITASARLGLIKQLRVQQETTYKNFKKFQTDSRMVESRF